MIRVISLPAHAGKNIVVDCDLTIKMFDHRGKFEKCFRIPALLADKENIRNRLKNRSCLEYILYIYSLYVNYIHSDRIRR